MFEFLIIFSLIRGFSLKSLSGKEFQQLSQQEMEKVQKEYHKVYAKFFKKNQMPPETIEQYFPKLQKQAKSSLIIGFVLIPLYIALLYWIFSTNALGW